MSSNIAPKEYVEDVRGHYEELPYPYRDPAEEGKHFYGCDGFTLDALSHFGWGGKRDLRHSKARILIAGNGTGDGAIQFAEALYGSDAEIHAIDLSSRSIAISEERLARRQLSNVTHHHMSLLDLPNSGLGKFDIIECCGVLHHLSDPEAGLKALADVLSDDGIMSIMVYAKYGRTPIYMVQELMRHLQREGMSRAEKIEQCRAFLDAVPATHWLTVKNEMFLGDIFFPDGSGVFDLFLHSIDRAYTVPQLYEWVEGAGLNLVTFFSDFTDDSYYQPEYYSQNPKVLLDVASKPQAERYAIGELMNGTMIKHHFYVTKEPKAPPTLEDDMVISYGLVQSLFTGYVVPLLDGLAPVPVGTLVNCSPRPFAHAPTMTITKRPATELLLKAINGKHSVGEIIAEVARIGKLSRNDVKKDLATLYTQLRTQQLVFLRHESIPPYVTGPQINQRLKSIGLIS